MAETLVGREDELTRLEAALDGLDDGAAGCVAIEGEPGIGKTRLLAELRRRAEERGHVVLQGQAAEFERDLPFGLVTETLDPYLTAQALDTESFDDEHHEELAAIFPALRNGGNGAAGTLGDERYRAHRAVRSLLEHLSEDKPLVLVLDDLHWGDDATVELLAALLRRVPDAPVLLALGFRPSGASERLTAALAAPLANRIALGPLSESECTTLLGDEVEASAAAAIYRHGGGNPFFVEQLARADGTGRELAGGSGLEPGLGSVPAAVTASLAEELATLTDPARRLLDAAAVAGEPFDPTIAAEIAELETAAMLTALDELLAIDLVRETQVPRRFIFRHPLVRRTVYESIGGGSRLAAHGRAANALAATGAPAAERAHHVEQAAERGDAEAIAVLLEAAARSASQAPSVSIRWLEAALRLLPEEDAERRVEVRISIASALRSVGEFERCRETLLETIELLPDDDLVRRVELTTWCAAVEHWLGRHEAARSRLFASWEALSDRTGAEATALQVELAVDGLYTMDLERTIEMGTEALTNARALGSAPLIAEAAAALALGEASQGLTAAAHEHRSEAVEILDRLDDAELSSSLEAFYYIAWVENYLERYDDSLSHIDRAITISRATGQGRLVIPLMLTRGYPLELQGRLAEATQNCVAAVKAARLSANPHYLFWALFELGFACYFAGDLAGATAACEESLEFGDRLTGGTIPSAGGGPGWALAVTLVTAGETERGLAAMRALGSDKIEFAVPVERCFDWEMFALAELAVGNPDAAENCASQAETLAATLDLQLPAGLAARTRAAILLDQGSAAEAVEQARAAVDGCAAAGAHLQAAFSRSLLGNALAAADQRTEAIEELREAERVLDSCGSVRERDSARRELRRLGARREARGPAAGESGIDSLTKRELEIAGLVTDRRTNKEIAAELFLSEKTIESHLRNIFFKLGVSSRVDVARAFERDRREFRRRDVSVEAAEAPSADELRLAELGYRQELRRGLRLGDSAALGFAGISPVVGLYAVVLVGTAVAGPAWIWVLPVALAGQCLLLAVYSELASQYPIAGGAYQWSRRLLGGSYGWFNGWVAVCAYAAANTTIAYLGAPWLLTLLEIDVTPEAVVFAGMALLVLCAGLGALGVQTLARAVKVGIAAEVLASVGIAIALLLAFRNQELAILGDTLGAEALSGGSVLAAMLAALAVGGWVFIGFDCAVGVAEETRDAARHIPKAIWIALLSVGALVIVNAIAVTLAHPDPAAIVAGKDIDPVTTSVVTSFGSWSDKPFAAVVLAAFIACGVAAQAVTARTIYSMARDDGMPGARFLSRVDRRQVPIGGVIAATVVGALGLLLGLEATAVGGLIAFGTAAIYVSFLLVASAALIARLRGSWHPSGRWLRGRTGMAINVAAVAWLAFETVNIAWPRASLAPPDAPFYQVWAAPLVLAVIGIAGFTYLAVARPGAGSGRSEQGSG